MYVCMLLLLLLIHTFSVLSVQLKKLLRHNKSAIDLSNADPGCGRKKLPRSTGPIVMITRYSGQQGSKSRQNGMRFCKQWYRPVSKWFIEPLTPYREQPRSTRIAVVYPRSASSATKRNNTPPISFDQQVQVSRGHTSYQIKEN